MNSIKKEIPLYQSHKKVRALEIYSLVCNISEGTAKLVFVDKTYEPINISLAMITRYVPVSGDFYVVYEDSYESFSPRKVFLEGYTKCSF